MSVYCKLRGWWAYDQKLGRRHFKIRVVKGTIGEKDDDFDENWNQDGEFDRDEYYTSEQEDGG